VDFEAAFHDHNAPLFRYVQRLLGDADVAADVVQESFVRLLRHPMPDADIRRWLFTVATNLVRDHARMETRRQRLLSERYEGPSVGPGPEEAASRAESVETARRALDRLSPRDREMLLMREEGFRYAEIAEAVGVAPGSVGTLLARALRRFGAELEAPSMGADEGDRNGPAQVPDSGLDRKRE
jgi:RNA polymerase sigma-70 factor (ECF subfamily)